MVRNAFVRSKDCGGRPKVSATNCRKRLVATMNVKMYSAATGPFPKGLSHAHSMNLTAGIHHSKNPQTIKFDDKFTVGVMTDFPVNSVNRTPVMVIKKAATYANWTTPAPVDISQPHNEALSKASGLTPPR